MRILSRSKKPFAGNPWLVVCEGLTFAGFLLTLYLMSHTTGLSFALFVIIGVPVLLISATITVVLLFHDFRRRYSLFGIEEYDRAEVIFQEGDAADRVYIIQEGEVDVMRSVQGKEVVLARLGPGDYFGEMAFFVADGRRTATVRTATSVTLQVLGKENFTRLMEVVPAARKEFSAKANERLKEHEG